MEAYKLLLELKIALLNIRMDNKTREIISRNMTSMEKQLKHSFNYPGDNAEPIR